VLQPGESFNVPVYYAGWQQPWNFSYPPVSWNLGVVQASIKAKTFTFTTPTGAAASAPSSTPKPSSSPTSQGSQPSP